MGLSEVLGLGLAAGLTNVGGMHRTDQVRLGASNDFHAGTFRTTRYELSSTLRPTDTRATLKSSLKLLPGPGGESQASSASAALEL